MKAYAKLAALAVAALGMVACGGSSGGSVPASSRGPVQGFGSVVVNGVRWSTAGASLRLDDSTESLANEDSIKTFVPEGAIVTVKGDRDGTSGTARQIEFKSIIEGPATNVNAPGGFTIAGLQILTDASTAFIDASGARVTTPLPNGRVEVSGAPESGAVLRATMVRAKAGNQVEFEAKGFVLGFSGSTFAISLDPAGPAYLNVTPTGAPPAFVANGVLVEVKGTAYAPLTNTLTATTIELEDNLVGDNNTEMEVEGVITQLGGTTPNETFVVAGQRVSLNAGTRFVGAANPASPRADLADAIKVEVEGRLDGSNTLVAEKLKYKDGARLRAPVQPASSGASFNLFGQRVVIDGRTRNDGATITPGQIVEVRGYPRSDGIIYAQRIRPESDDRPFLQGVATAAADPSVTIFGIPVSLSGAEFRGTNEQVLTRSEFFRQVTPGVTFVKIRWDRTATGPAGEVDEAEIESEDD